MVRYDPFGRTEGMRGQVKDFILTAYIKGYNDGEQDEQDRKLEMLLKEKKGRWSLKMDLLTGYEDAVCSECGAEFIEGSQWCNESDYWNFCPYCGAKMEV